MISFLFLLVPMRVPACDNAFYHTLLELKRNLHDLPYRRRFSVGSPRGLRLPPSHLQWPAPLDLPQALEDRASRCGASVQRPTKSLLLPEITGSDED